MLPLSQWKPREWSLDNSSPLPEWALILFNGLVERTDSAKDREVLDTYFTWRYYTSHGSKLDPALIFRR